MPKNGVRCFWQRMLLLMEYCNFSIFPPHLKVRQKRNDALCSEALKILCASSSPDLSTTETLKLYYFPLLLWQVTTNRCLKQLKLIIFQFRRPEIQPESPWAKNQGVSRAEFLLEIPGRVFLWVFQLLEDTCLPLLIAPSSIFRASCGGSRAFPKTYLWLTSCSHISFWLSCETFSVRILRLGPVR